MSELTDKPGYCVCGRALFYPAGGQPGGAGCLNPKCPRNICGSLHEAARIRGDVKRSNAKKNAKAKKTEPKSLYGAEYL